MNKQTMIEHLNEDFAGELSAIIQYLTYAAKATGPYRPQLAQFFLTEVADEQLHAQFLANKIVALGGEPVTTPRPVAAASTNREMLEAVLPPNAVQPPITPNVHVKPTSLATKGWRCSWRTWCATKAATLKKPSACCATGRCRIIMGGNRTHAVAPILYTF